jgi:Holliday junction resolvase RusA-like endonuclease
MRGGQANEMKITLPYPPTVNNLYINVGNHRVPSKQALAYKIDVQEACMVKRFRPLDGNVQVSVSVYRPRKSGDLDNTLKAILDGIKGWAFHDDKQVIEIHAYRFDDKDNPRAEVEIQAL